jgi:hypothetical protein
MTTSSTIPAPATSFKFSGKIVTDARLFIPAWGCCYADISIDGEFPLTGKQTLVLNDLNFSGTILSGGPATGRSFFRVVAGAGGWGKTVAKRSYANDAGVKLITVLIDVAQEVGETFDLTTIDPSATVGTSFARPSEPASRVLEQVAQSNWYVDVDGLTRIGKRKPSDLTGKVTITSPTDRAAGEIELSSETIAAIKPGLMIEGLTILDVVHEIAEGKLRTNLYGELSTSTNSRRLDAWRVLLDQLDPNRKFRATWEYRLVTKSGNRVNLQPVLTSSGMPDLQNVKIRPGVAGAKNSLALGCLVLVTFVNGSPNQAQVTGVEDADGGGFLPLTTSIDSQATTSIHAGTTTSVDAGTTVELGGATSPVARLGDIAGIWPISTVTQVKVLA